MFLLFATAELILKKYTIDKIVIRRDDSLMLQTLINQKYSKHQRKYKRLFFVVFIIKLFLNIYYL